MMTRHLRAITGSTLTLWLIALTGCSGGASVELKGEFPTPLVVPAPVRVALVLEPSLTGYVHEEDIERGGHWRLDIGAMQPKLFRSVFNALFSEVVEVPSLAGAQGFAGVLVPAIDKLQIAIPTQTRSDFYEVWIRYVVRLYGADGQLIVEWPLTAYGKASKDAYGFLEDSDQPGMEDAAMTAMRDAGAFLALRFPNVPEVERWLAANGGGAAP
jgi:hypothetical protein